MKFPRALLPFVLTAAACGGGADGTLAVYADVDPVIASGLPAGTGPEEIADGWSLTYEHYAVHFDEVRVGKLSRPEKTRTLEVARVVDLARVSGQAYLGELVALSPGRWDSFSYAIGAAREESACDESAGLLDDPSSVCRAMIDEGLAVFVVGTLEKADGQSCPPDDTADDPFDSCAPASRVTFRLELPLEASFVECRTESGLGVGIPSAGRASVALSYHSEHLLYNAFGEGARNIVLRAQFLANADLDLDGVVTMEELESIPRSRFEQLFTNGTDIESFSAAYSLSGALLPIDTAADYVAAHLLTQGHLDGESECEPEIR